MQRSEILNWLGDLDPSDRFPLWIISHGRAGTAPWLNKAAEWSTAETVNVVVRESSEAAYRKAYPMFRVHPLPDDMVGNCGSARWGAASLAYADGDEAALMYDDDVLKVGFLFGRQIQSGKNIGMPASAPDTADDLRTLPDLEERVLAGQTAISREVFVDNPKAVLGSLRKRHMSFNAQNHGLKYLINGGVTPRQSMVYHLARMWTMGIKMNTNYFGVHGEDIGMTAEVLAAGADCFTISSLIFDHWPESVNITRSQIRNADNAPELHVEEHEHLMEYPIRDYLRTKNGWNDVDWRKLAKVRGTPARKVWWDDAAEHLNGIL